ncbi:transcription elongation factor TFIIS [Cystobasidiomycetes sp. EMM_F5]
MNNLDSILTLRKALVEAESADNVQDIKNVLQQLKTEVKATEELLRETKVGLKVGKLRSHANKDIVALARELVKKAVLEMGTTNAIPLQSWLYGFLRRSGEKTWVVEPKPTKILAHHKVHLPVQNHPLHHRLPKPRLLRMALQLHQKPPSEGSPPPPLESGRLRTTETDKVRTEITNDKTRNNCIRLIYDALAIGSLHSTTIILSRATDVESGAWNNKKDEGGYRQKMRSLVLTLKAKDNPDLRSAVVAGEVEAAQLWSMTPAELASAEKKAELAKMHEQALWDAQGAAPKKSETDMFECSKCKKRRTTYYQMQTRSADEPMTTFVSCLNCGNNWRFS